MRRCGAVALKVICGCLQEPCGRLSISETEKRLELIPDEVLLGDTSELTATAFTNVNGHFEHELPPGSYDVTAFTKQVFATQTSSYPIPSKWIMALG
jgi:hypothetical protein